MGERKVTFIDTENDYGKAAVLIKETYEDGSFSAVRLTYRDIDALLDFIHSAFLRA